jgi:hypothetical protein
MNFTPFGPKNIFRPRESVCDELHGRAQAALLREFKTGVYVGRDEVNPILKRHFQFYERRLLLIAPKIASRGSADLLLHQYDEASEILHGMNIHSFVQREAWARIEPGFKRGIKYLVELMCIAGNPGEAKIVKRNSGRAAELLEEALLCAETAADLAELSNRSHQIFPEDFELNLHSAKSPYFFETRIRGLHADFDKRFGERVATDRKLRHKFMGATPQFDTHTDSHTPFLNELFEKEFGMSYSLFIYGLMTVIDGSIPHLGGFPTLFIKRSELMKQLKKSERPKEALEAMVRGFTVTPQLLNNEGRVLWNAKQESRAYRRGFFLFPHISGGHLAFSQSMAKESLIHLVIGACYQKLPQEWHRGDIPSALSRLSNAAGKWFERILAENLKAVGFIGSAVKDCLGNKKHAITIPSEIGDLDYIGYHAERKMILLIEAKMTNTGVESQFWRDDVDRFVTRKDSYAQQYRRKIAWVRDNLREVELLLGAPSHSVLEARMITLYPCIATEFINDFKCQSITELMLEMG